MLFRYFFILYSFISHYSFSQNCFQNAWGLEKLQFGYSTTYDAEQVLGNGYFLIANTLHHRAGISLIFNENKILESIILSKPFKGSFRNGFYISLDSSNIEDVSHFFPNHVANLTQNAQRCSFKTSLDSCNIEFQAYSIKTSGITEYKDYSLQKINIFPQFHSLPKSEKKEDTYCEAPLYAPESENHLNCWIFEYSGGFMGALEPVEHGYHKYYSLKHKLESEGNFYKGEKTGVWKYYDENGKIIDTKKHYHFDYPVNWVDLIIALIIFILIFFKASRKRN